MFFSTRKLSMPLIIHTYFDKDVSKKRSDSIKGVVGYSQSGIGSLVE